MSAPRRGQDYSQHDLQRQLEDLRNERRFVSAVLDTAGALVLVLDRQGRIVRFNRACERLTGYTFEEVAGQRFWENFLIPEEMASVKDVFEDLRSGNFPNQHDNYWLMKNGDRRLISWSNTALVDEDGEVEYIVATGIDITDRADAEEALRRSEKRYRQLVESAHEGVWVIDADNKTTFVNAHMAGMLGYAVEEMVGKHLFSFMDERGIEISTANLERRRLGIEEQHDFEFLHRNGSRVYTILETSPLTDDIGNYCGALALVTDITARKQTEAQIQEQNRFIVGVFESLGHPFYVVDARDYTVLMANSVTRSTGTSEATTCYGLTHRLAVPCMQAGCVCPLEQVKRTGQPAVVEHSHFDQDGHPRAVEVHCHPIFDAHGQVSQVIEYTLDITERKRAAEALVASEARHRTLIEAMNEGLALLDQNRTISYVNHALCGMLGYSRAELLGCGILDILYHTQAHLPGAEISRRFTGEAKTYETVLRRKDGQPLPVILSGSSLLDADNHQNGSVIVVTDITLVKRTEKELHERTRELSTLLDISRERALSPELHPLLELILVRLLEVVEVDAAAISRLEGETLTELARANRAALPEGIFRPLTSLGKSPIGHRVIANQQPVIISDIWSDSWPAAEFRAIAGEHFAASHADMHAWLAMPLVVEDRTLGIMALWYHVP
jgi:PAS domain S-box-containing protein